MATEETKVEGEIPETEKPADKTAAIDPAEFEKLQKALKEANKEAASRRKRLDELEQAEAARKAAEMTELERAQARLQELEAKQKLLERKDAQRKAADSVGLPPELAERLVGDNEEALAEDAKKLMEALKLQKPTAPKLPPTNAASGEKVNDMDAIRARRDAKRQSAMQDLSLAKQKGGGVVWNTKE